MRFGQITEGLAAIALLTIFSLTLPWPTMARYLLTHRAQVQPAQTNEEQQQQHPHHHDALPTIDLTRQEGRRSWQL
jgi:hypothetical protein